MPCLIVIPSSHQYDFSVDEKPPKPGTASLLGARAGSWLAHSPTVVGEAKLAFGPGDAGRAPKSAPAVPTFPGRTTVACCSDVHLLGRSTRARPHREGTHGMFP